jgi:hypothetical protein
VAESCTGTDPACPPDTFQPSTVTCRPSVGVCDVTENCSGSAAACPPDAKSTAVCRPATGLCDVAERCDGVSNGCPADALAPAGTVCRPSTPTCDVAETCTGTSPACPPDPCDPCTNIAGVIATKTRLVLKHLLTPPGDDALTFTGVLTGVPTTPPINPAQYGVRIVIQPSDPLAAPVLDVTIPGGAGWTTGSTGRSFTYHNAAGAQGITKVALKVGATLPIQVHYTIVGKSGSFAVTAGQLPLTGIVVIDTPDPTTAVCGQATFPGGGRTCTMGSGGATVTCKVG